MAKINSRVSVVALQKAADEALEHCLVEREEARKAKNEKAYQELTHTMFRIHAIRLNYKPPHAFGYASKVRSRAKKYFKKDPETEQVSILLGKTGTWHRARETYLTLEARRTGRVKYGRGWRDSSSIDIPSVEKHEGTIALLVP